jgi:PAS domain S-box-containing protein
VTRDGRLLHIVEKMESNVFWVDRQYRYVAFSPAHRKTMRARFGAEVVLGRRFLDYVPDPGQRAIVKDLLDQALGGRTIVEVGAKGMGQAGERHLEATYTPVPGSDGAVTGVFVTGRDVTAADRVEAELWRREHQLAQSQRVARMGHWYSSLDDDGVDLSGQALKMVADLKGAGELHTLDDVRATVRRLVHPEDRAKAERLIEWSVTDEPIDFEFRVVDGVGRLSHLTGRVEVVTEADGRKGMLGVFQDDTEHWRTEQELRLNEARLRRAEELSGLGHWSVTPATGATSWSPGLYEIFGLDPETVAPSASRFFEMIHPDDRDTALEYAAQVNAGTPCERIVHRIVRPDGEVRLLSSRGETRRDETGEAVLYFGTALDITELTQAKQDLESSEDRYRLLFESMTQGFVHHGSDGSITTANPAAAELLGISPDQLLGRTSMGPEWRAVRPDGSDLPGEEHPAMVAIRTGETVVDQVMGVYVPALGERRWFSVTATPVLKDPDGSVAGSIAVFSDVTGAVNAQAEVDRLDRQLRGRMRELAAANEQLNDLLYSLAHDLRSPLRAIDGFSLAFAEDHVDAIDPRGAEQIGRVRAAAMRLGMLFDAALELADVRRGEVVLSEVDLTTLARTVVDALREDEPHRKTVFLVPDGLTAVADEGLARTVLEQLLANAWTATTSRRPGRIAVGSVVVGGEPRFFVRDDGVGFDQSYAAKVFGSYQQLQPPRADSGAGVGLTMVRHACGRLGGRCWAEAEPDRGATFWFTLGAAPHDAAGAGFEP